MGRKSSRKAKRQRGNVGGGGISAPKGAGRGAGKWYFVLVVIGVVIVASYANSVNNDFVFDDIHLIVEHGGIRGIGNIPRLLGAGKWRSSYRPVRMVSYAIDYTLNKKIWGKVFRYGGGDAGLNPAGYHIANWVYHLMAVVLVFLVVRRLTGSGRIGLIAAGLFGLHPVQTDSVTYMSGRRDILCGLFYLVGFYYFLRYREGGNVRFLLASLGGYGLSLGSKEMGVTLPLLFVCYDVVEGFGKGEKERGYGAELLSTIKSVVMRSKYLYGISFVGGLGYGYYKVFIKSPSHQVGYYGDSMVTTFLTVGKILVYYLKLLIYPIRLQADYSYDAFPLSTSLFEPSTLVSFMILGVMVYVVGRLMVRERMAAFGMIWFFVTLLPVCHIIPHHELLAEHYLYLPSVGFCLVVGVVIDGMLREGRYRAWVYGCGVLVVVLFALRIMDRNRDWKDGLTLWKKTVQTAPRCARANANLCGEYTKRGYFDEALSSCNHAISIDSRWAEAHNNLGATYVRLGDFEKAISAYTRALRVRPRYMKAHFNLGYAYFKIGRYDEALYEYWQALRINPRSAEIYNSCGVAYVKKGQLDKAIFAYKRALEFNPDYVDAHYNLGIAYKEGNKLDKAIDEFKKAIDLNPDRSAVHTNLASVYLKKGETDLAIKQYIKALALQQDSAQAHYNLAVAYEKRGYLEKAVAEYKRALTLQPNQFSALNNLGNVYYRQGRFNAAIDVYKRSLALKEDFAATHSNLAMAYFKTKQYQLAIKHCDRALMLGVNNRELLLKLRPFR